MSVVYTVALERSGSKLCNLLHVNKLDSLNNIQMSSNPLLLVLDPSGQYSRQSVKISGDFSLLSPALSNVNMLFVRCLDSYSGLDRDFVSSESLARSNWLSVVLSCCGQLQA